jgi:MoaA/NifB/PqqE/SkfB family radical SAM enzyme
VLISHRIGFKISRYFAPIMQYRAFLPEAVNIYPTDRCNLSCSMCFEKFRTPRPERRLEEWHEVIDFLARFKPRIHLSGGEPLLYKGIDELIARLKLHRLYVAITTNGFFLEQHASVIVKQGVNAITVSIDGPRDVHDHIRGVAGSFDRIMHGLNSLQQHRVRTGFPALRINSMINASDPAAMQEVIRIAVHYGAETIQFLHPMFASEQDLAAHRHYLMTNLGRGLNYWQGAQAVAQKHPDIEQLEKVCKDLRRESAVRVELFPSFTSEQMRYYYTMDPRFSVAMYGQCHAMWSTATILPSGDVESCPDYIIGNCITNRFKDLWNNEAIQRLRMRIRQQQFFTVCRACCFFYL